MHARRKGGTKEEEAIWESLKMGKSPQEVDIWLSGVDVAKVLEVL
jgi:hypothetical protein